MTVKQPTNINHLWADLIVEELIRNGVDTFCISPGSRSAPLTLAVARHSRTRSFVHFDERGIAFFALGITSSTGRACAVITTSGTAAANCFPAVIEASKKKLPMIVLTADRPPELRATGAHQTIDQVKIYGDYARWHVDLPCPTTEMAPEFVLTTVDAAVSRANGNPCGPVHLNCMFREPLAPVNPRASWSTYAKSIRNWKAGTDVYTKYIRPKPALQRSDIDRVLRTLRSIKSGIIVAGKLKSDAGQHAVLRIAEKLHWPIVADVSSGLRLGNDHKHVIHYFDQILLSDKASRTMRCDGVLHVGGRITSKRWYAFLEKAAPASYIMVLNHPLRSDPLHAVTTRIECDVAAFCRAVERETPQRSGGRLLSRLQKLDRAVDRQVDAFLQSQGGLSEPLVARLITRSVPRGNGIFVANSMPIRDIDMYSNVNGQRVAFGANRGASGIDGTIATAIGFAQGLAKRTTLLIGDLAFLHDLNSLAMLRDLKIPMVIVVLNNNGGGIFSFLPLPKARRDFERFFGTPHHLTFSAAADLFDLNYARPESPSEFARTYRAALKSLSTTIIEIATQRAYNLDVHARMEREIVTAVNKVL